MAYVVEKAGLHYAVIYEGVNPITGRSGGDGIVAPTELTQKRSPANSGRGERGHDGRARR